MAPIDGGMREKLSAGMTLVASYKKAEHRAEVIEGEDGKVRFRLEDGREFGSPSAAGSAVMGGVACNGWRFWSIAGDGEPESKPAKATRKAAAKPRTRGAKAEPANDAEPPAESPETAEQPVTATDEEPHD